MIKDRGGRLPGWSNPKLNATTTPTLEDIIWAAGFYEGEGNCKIDADCYSFQMRITQVNKWPLIWMKKRFGGSLKQRKNQQGIYWHFVLCGSRAKSFAAAIYKFLSPKRKKQIKKALEWANRKVPWFALRKNKQKLEERYNVK